MKTHEMIIIIISSNRSRRTMLRRFVDHCYFLLRLLRRIDKLHRVESRGRNHRYTSSISCINNEIKSQCQ